MLPDFHFILSKIITAPQNVIDFNIEDINEDIDGYFVILKNYKINQNIKLFISHITINLIIGD
jgi:hypothetical protein